MKALHCLAAALVALLIVGAVTAEEKGAGKSARFTHVVIFYVNKDAPAGTVEGMIADAHELLAKIPTVREVRAAKPAANGTPIARKDYQVGLVVLFDDAEGLKAYADHPLHKQYVEKYLKYCDPDRLSIFDFEDTKK